MIQPPRSLPYSGHKLFTDRQIVCAAARFAFCIYHGIKVTSVKLVDGNIKVSFSDDHMYKGKRQLDEYIETLLSGVVTTATIFDEESGHCLECASEAERAFQLASSESLNIFARFDDVLKLLRTRIESRLTDPKVFKAIEMTTQEFVKLKGNLDAEALQKLISLTRYRLA